MEKLENFSSVALLDELIKAAMVVNELGRNESVPEKIKKEKKQKLKTLKEAVLKRLEKKSE